MDTEIDRATYIMTGDAPVYDAITEKFAGHGTVNHSIEEYVRAHFWHTNTAEGYFSILKRGIIGTYHHVSAEHLHRYLAEFDFRYNAPPPTPPASHSTHCYYDRLTGSMDCYGP
jgi:hypothetical protein